MQLTVHRVVALNISHHSNNGVKWVELDILSENAIHDQVLLFISDQGMSVYNHDEVPTELAGPVPARSGTIDPDTVEEILNPFEDASKES